MYAFIVRIIPKKISARYYNLFDFARIKFDKERFLSFFVVLSIGLAIAFSLILSLLFSINFLLLFAASLIILHLAFYFTISLKADATAKFVENILPDALQLMTSNLRAGLTTDRALLLSARPEFGALSDEIYNVGKKVALGEDMGDALIQLAWHFRSERLKKTMLLIVSGIRSGGELTDLLDQTAENLRQERFLDEKIRTNVLMYVIFIFAAIGFGSPLLFGLSSFLIEVLTKNLALVEIPETSTLPITFSQITISPSFVLVFSLVSLITTSILGSLVLGLISRGKEKAGIKFIPILVALTLAVFFITRLVIGSLLSGLFGL